MSWLKLYTMLKEIITIYKGEEKNNKKNNKIKPKKKKAKGDSDHAIQIRCGWRASMNPCSSIPSPEGDCQPLEELTRRLWGRDPKALAYEAAYAGDGVHSGVTQPSKSFDGKREKRNASRLACGSVGIEFSLLSY